MSDFFKNVWFRCISVLLVIAVVLGGLLAVLNDVLYVTSEERTGRAIKKIYGENKEYTVTLDVDGEDEKIEYDFVGSINKIYVVGDKKSGSYDTLFQATGYQGYKNGTITVWVKVTHSEGKAVIDKVILESYDKQTLMSKLGDAFLGGFYLDISDNYDTYFTAKTKDEGNKNPVSGATMSAMAGCNAVNCVIEYMKGVI